MLERAIANGHQSSIRPSVRPSVCHIHEPRLNGSVFEILFTRCDRAMFLVSWGQIL